MSHEAVAQQRNERRVRLWLLVTLCVDGGCVTALTVDAVAGPVPSTGAAWAYSAIGAAGVLLAAVAVFLTRLPAGVEAATLHRRSAIGLLVCGLVINSAGCLYVLALTSDAAGRGWFLLVGGDLLSAVYLVLCARLTSAAGAGEVPG